MDQTTHELRLADWQTIVNNCLARPAGQSKKQWLEEHGVPVKPYYYWQRKIRQLVYSRQQQSEIPAEEPTRRSSGSSITALTISTAAASPSL